MPDPKDPWAEFRVQPSGGTGAAAVSDPWAEFRVQPAASAVERLLFGVSGRGELGGPKAELRAAGDVDREAAILASAAPRFAGVALPSKGETVRRVVTEAVFGDPDRAAAREAGIATQPTLADLTEAGLAGAGAAALGGGAGMTLGGLITHPMAVLRGLGLSAGGSFAGEEGARQLGKLAEVVGAPEGTAKRAAQVGGVVGAVAGPAAGPRAAGEALALAARGALGPRAARVVRAMTASGVAPVAVAPAVAAVEAAPAAVAVAPSTVARVGHALKRAAMETPAVKPGFRRLYRGDVPGTEGGGWYTSDPAKAATYAVSKKGGGVSFVDVPIRAAEGYRQPNGFYRLPADARPAAAEVVTTRAPGGLPGAEELTAEITRLRGLGLSPSQIGTTLSETYGISAGQGRKFADLVLSGPKK